MKRINRKFFDYYGYNYEFNIGDTFRRKKETFTITELNMGLYLGELKNEDTSKNIWLTPTQLKRWRKVERNNEREHKLKDLLR